jgi:hypothetical protein
MLGYTYYTTKDTLEVALLESYCLGKNFLWNMFLGWRRTKCTKDGDIYTYILKREDLEEITILKKYTERF